MHHCHIISVLTTYVLLIAQQRLQRRNERLTTPAGTDLSLCVFAWTFMLNGVMNLLAALVLYVCNVSEVHVSPRLQQKGKLSNTDYSRSLLQSCREDSTLSLHAYSLSHARTHKQTQTASVSSVTALLTAAEGAWLSVWLV